MRESFLSYLETCLPYTIHKNAIFKPSPQILQNAYTSDLLSFGINSSLRNKYNVFAKWQKFKL